MSQAYRALSSSLSMGHLRFPFLLTRPTRNAVILRKSKHRSLIYQEKSQSHRSGINPFLPSSSSSFFFPNNNLVYRLPSSPHAAMQIPLQNSRIKCQQQQTNRQKPPTPPWCHRNSIKYTDIQNSIPPPKNPIPEKIIIPHFRPQLLWAPQPKQKQRKNADQETRKPSAMQKNIVFAVVEPESNRISSSTAS